MRLHVMFNFPVFVNNKSIINYQGNPGYIASMYGGTQHFFVLERQLSKALTFVESGRQFSKKTVYDFSNIFPWYSPVE